VKQFARTIRNVLDRHSAVVLTMARGLLEMKMRSTAAQGDGVDPSTQYFLGIECRIELQLLMIEYRSILYESHWYSNVNWAAS